MALLSWARRPLAQIVCLMAWTSQLVNSKLSYGSSYRFNTVPNKTQSEKIYQHTKVVLGVNKSDEKTGTDILMSFDLQFNDVQVPDLNQDGFGFNCTSDNNCEYLDNQSSWCKDYVSPIQAECRLMRFPFRFDNSSIEKPVISFMNASSISVNAELWLEEQGEVGYIGLGPSSPFWTYLNEAYETPNGESYHKFSFSVPRTLGLDSSNYSAIKFYQSKASLNKKYSLGRTLKYTSNNVQDNRWTLFNSSFYLASDSSFMNTKACIDLQLDSYILIPQQDYQSFLNNTTIQLCGQNFSQRCHLNKSNVANVRPINVTFEDSNGERLVTRLDPQDYIRFDSSGNYYLLIDQAGRSRTCPSEGFVIGGLLAEKFEFTIWSRQGSPPTLEVSQLYAAEDATTFSWLTAIAMATLALLTTIILGVQTSCFGLNSRPSKSANVSGGSLGKPDISKTKYAYEEHAQEKTVINGSQVPVLTQPDDYVVAPQ